MTPFVLTRDLYKTYRKGTVPIPVLQGVSLEMARGEYVSVVGRSGSGKSTLLNLLGGLDTATSGLIVVGDSDVTSMSRQDLAVHRRSTVGMIFQSFNLIPSRTALENITLALAFGLALGWVVTRIANAVANHYLRPQGVPEVDLFYMPVWLIAGALVFSVGVSLLAGLYPASRAARVDPVQALRHD